MTKIKTTNLNPLETSNKHQEMIDHQFDTGKV